MIGVCRMEKGDAAGAVQAYQRALHSDYLTTDAARALHYEVAGAYEASGDRASALQYLQKVMKIDPVLPRQPRPWRPGRLGAGGRIPPRGARPRPARRTSAMSRHP